MKQLIIAILLLAGMPADKYPKTIAGKWEVDNVVVADLGNIMSATQKETMVKNMTQSFVHSTFELKANHQCTTTVKMKELPPAHYWDYDATTGVLYINQDKENKVTIMVIQVTDTAGKITFALQGSPVTLMVHRKA
jgi:hypothetical protein